MLSFKRFRKKSTLNNSLSLEIERSSSLDPDSEPSTSTSSSGVQRPVTPIPIVVELTSDNEFDREYHPNPGYQVSKQRSNSYDVTGAADVGPSSPDESSQEKEGFFSKLTVPGSRRRGRSLEIPKICVHCAYMEEIAKSSQSSRTSDFNDFDDNSEDDKSDFECEPTCKLHDNPPSPSSLSQSPSSPVKPTAFRPPLCKETTVNSLSVSPPQVHLLQVPSLYPPDFPKLRSSSLDATVGRNDSESPESSSSKEYDARSVKPRASSFDVSSLNNRRPSCDVKNRMGSKAIAAANDGIENSLLHPNHAEHGYLPPRVWKSFVDWTDCATNGDHIWVDTNCSGEFCYVGETECTKSGQKKKCIACKIIIHVGCAAQLDKIGFRCKSTFREGSAKNYRDGRHGELFIKHHWVHRRRQEGKCKTCGKSFQQKFPFNNKDVIAISCSWCKTAYHNKLNCFMMHFIEESCNLGSLSSLILPPSWVVKAPPRRRNSGQGRRRSSHKLSGKRKPGCKNTGSFFIKPVPSVHVKPVLVFVNPKSGGNQGLKLLHKFQWLLNPRQVFDLGEQEPGTALQLFRSVPGLRVLVCGGDGTAGWVLSAVDKLGIFPFPPVAVLPLGTGNDLARTLNWGSGYTDEPLTKVLCCVEEGRVLQLDRWSIEVQPNEEAPPDETERSATEKPYLNVFNNYFSIGADANVALEFHESREANPDKFNSRWRNMMFYAGEGSRSIVRRLWRDLSNVVFLECDGVDLTERLRVLRVNTILFLNIPKYSAGTMPWGNPQGFEPQRHDDGFLEVIGFSPGHLATVQIGWHGFRLCQCKSAVLTTHRAIPIQIDGEPFRLKSAVITISHKNQANMIQKPKRRSSIPLPSDCIRCKCLRRHPTQVRAGSFVDSSSAPDLTPDPSMDGEYGLNCSNSEPLILERLRLQVSLVTQAIYEELRYNKDRLREASYPLGIIVVEGDCDLETVRGHINRLVASTPIQTAGGPLPLSENWLFLDSTTAERFFRIDRSQESMHFVTDISMEDLYLLDPDFHPEGPLEPPSTVLPALLVHKPIDETVLIAQCDQSLDDSLERQLLVAARCGSLPQVRILQAAGVDLMAVDPLGQNCLHLAALCGSPELVAHLASSCPALLDLPCTDRGQTPLHKACALRNRGAARALVEAGAAVTITDIEGMTPRQQAQAAGDSELVSWLESQEHLQLVTREDQETAV